MVEHQRGVCSKEWLLGAESYWEWQIFCKGDRIGVLSEWIARCARYEGRKCLVPPIFSASKPILHTACVTPPTKCFHLEDAKVHLVWCHSGPCWTHFLAEHRTFCSQCCHCCGKSCDDWTGFSLLKRKTFLLEDFRYVTVVLSLFRLWCQFQVELPSRWPLKHSTGVRFQPSWKRTKADEQPLTKRSDRKRLTFLKMQENQNRCPMCVFAYLQQCQPPQRQKHLRHNTWHSCHRQQLKVGLQ